MRVVNTGTIQFIELTDEPIAASVERGDKPDRYTLQIRQGDGQILTFAGTARQMMAVMSSITLARWDK